MCSRFARRGYVAISADYRTGWNRRPSVLPDRISVPVACRAGCLPEYPRYQGGFRYIKNDVATANTYGIDTTKIILGGMGSGGYIALRLCYHSGYG